MPPTRIIVSDDSPGEKFTEILSSEQAEPVRARLPIEIHRGPQNGPYENFREPRAGWNGSSEL